MRDEQASVNQEGKDNSLTALQKDQNLLNPVKVQPRQKSTKSDKYTPQAPDNRCIRHTLYIIQTIIFLQVSL